MDTDETRIFMTINIVLQTLEDGFWKDFASESNSEPARKSTIEHWKKTAPRLAKKWRIIERLETVVLTDDKFYEEIVMEDHKAVLREMGKA